MAVTYTEYMRKDIVERLGIQVVNGTSERPDAPVTVLEAFTLLAEIERLADCLSIAEARLGRVASILQDAYLAALEGDEE